MSCEIRWALLHFSVCSVEKGFVTTVWNWTNFAWLTRGRNVRHLFPNISNSLRVFYTPFSTMSSHISRSKFGFWAHFWCWSFLFEWKIMLGLSLKNRIKALNNAIQSYEPGLCPKSRLVYQQRTPVLQVKKYFFYKQLHFVPGLEVAWELFPQSFRA